MAHPEGAGIRSKKAFVRAQFDGIASVYDLGNKVMSLGFDAGWRRKAVRRLGLEPGDFVLDVCGGTGDLARLAADRAGTSGLTVVCDFSPAMLAAGKRKDGRGGSSSGGLRLVQGDAESMGFAAERFDAVMAGFGVRNLDDVEAGLREMVRVLKPGGRLLILEFGVPPGRVWRLLYSLYSCGIMPLQGLLVYGSSGPPRYLVRSIRAFPSPERLVEQLERAGLAGVGFKRSAGGIAVAYTATKPGPAQEGGRKRWT